MKGKINMKRYYYIWNGFIFNCQEDCVNAIESKLSAELHTDEVSTLENALEDEYNYSVDELEMDLPELCEYLYNEQGYVKLYNSEEYE